MRKTETVVRRKGNAKTGKENTDFRGRRKRRLRGGWEAFDGTLPPSPSLSLATSRG